MDILAALRREEAKFEKAVRDAQQQLDTVRGAMKLLGGKVAGKKKRVMSAATKAKIAKTARARWAKIKAAKKGKA
jgi:hypothetical protein